MGSGAQGWTAALAKTGHVAKLLTRKWQHVRMACLLQTRHPVWALLLQPTSSFGVSSSLPSLGTDPWGSPAWAGIRVQTSSKMQMGKWRPRDNLLSHTAKWQNWNSTLIPLDTFL